MALAHVQKGGARVLCLCYEDNNRPMGHIAHLRNQFKSMNSCEQSYDYI